MNVWFHAGRCNNLTNEAMACMTQVNGFVFQIFALSYPRNSLHQVSSAWQEVWEIFTLRKVTKVLGLYRSIYLTTYEAQLVNQMPGQFSGRFCKLWLHEVDLSSFKVADHAWLSEHHSLTQSFIHDIKYFSRIWILITIIVFLLFWYAIMSYTNFLLLDILYCF